MKIKFKILLVVFLLVLISCKTKDGDKIIHKIENPFAGQDDKYYELSDGSFEYMGKTYRYYLELKGKGENGDTIGPVYVLSNRENLTIMEALYPLLSSDTRIKDNLDYVLLELGK